MSIKVRIDTSSITVPSKISPIHTFDGKIFFMLIEKQRVFFLLSSIYKDSFTIEKEIDPNNIYCFDFEGNLLWQTGRVEFTTYGGDTYIHPASDMYIDGNLLKLCYQMGLYRWLDPETGQVVKEEEFYNK